MLTYTDKTLVYIKIKRNPRKREKRKTIVSRYISYLSVLNTEGNL